MKLKSLFLTRTGVCVLIAGILSGVCVGFWRYKADNTKSIPKFYDRNWKARKAYCLDEAKMTALFEDNYDRFKQLELYYEEIEDWDFGFEQFIIPEGELDPSSGEVYEYWTDNYNLVTLSDSSVPEKIANFLNLTPAQWESMDAIAKSIIIHGNEDEFNPHEDISKYLEVRCYVGEEIVSFIYSPAQPVGDGKRDKTKEMGNDWYLCEFQNVPLKLRDQ